MKRSKIEFDSVWKAAIHDLLVREHYTNTKLESQIEGLNDEVINLMKSDAVKDDQIDDHERRLKKQEEIICRLLTDMSTLATDYMDLSIKLGDMAKTVDSLEADSEALMSDSVHLYQREKELQAQVDDQAEALEHLSTGMKNVAKALTNLDGWMTDVEVVLSALRKST